MAFLNFDRTYPKGRCLSYADNFREPDIQKSGPAPGPSGSMFFGGQQREVKLTPGKEHAATADLQIANWLNCK